MQNRVISLLVSLLIVGCSVDTIAMDSKNSEKVPSFARFAQFIPFQFIPKRLKQKPKPWWPRSWWKDYICESKLSAGEWHKKKIRTEVEQIEHELQQILKVPPLDPKNFYNFYFFTHNNKNLSPSDVQLLVNNEELMNSEEYGKKGKELFDQRNNDQYNNLELYEQPDIASKIKDHVKKNFNNKIDIPPIRVSKTFQSVGYCEPKDIIIIPEWCATLIACGHSDRLNQVVGSISHELAHREKKHLSMQAYYSLLAKILNRQDVVDTILTKYRTIHEREADIVGCVTGGPKICRWLKENIEKNIIDDSDHSPVEERVACLSEIIDEKEDSGQYFFNPDSKINGLSCFVNCGDCDKNMQKRISDFFKKCKSSATT